MIVVRFLIQLKYGKIIGEVVPFHGTGETAALADTRHVDGGDTLQNANEDFTPDLPTVETAAPRGAGGL